jgi:hypothetical protein
MPAPANQTGNSAPSTDTGKTAPHNQTGPKVKRSVPALLDDVCLRVQSACKAIGRESIVSVVSLSTLAQHLQHAESSKRSL